MNGGWETYHHCFEFVGKGTNKASLKVLESWSVKSADLHWFNLDLGAIGSLLNNQEDPRWIYDSSDAPMEEIWRPDTWGLLGACMANEYIRIYFSR